MPCSPRPAFLMTLLWVLLGVGIGVAVTVVYLTNRSIVPPILKMVGAMGQLAGGDHSVAIPATDKKDEIGLMARAVLIFKENMIKAKELADKEAEAIKARVCAGGAGQRTDPRRSTPAYRRVLRSVASASTELQATASSMTATAEETSNQATAVAAATEEASTNVQTVAAASEGAGELGHRDQPSGGAIRRDRAEGRRGGRSHQYDGAGPV